MSLIALATEAAMNALQSADIAAITGSGSALTPIKRPVPQWIVPALADCNPGCQPFEFQCVIAMGEKPEKTAGGIILTDDTKDKDNYGAERARLVAVSPAAFTYHAWGDHRTPQPGDIVLTSKYAGQAFEGQDGKPYRICTDKDIKAVIERAADPVRDQIHAAIGYTKDKL